MLKSQLSLSMATVSMPFAPAEPEATLSLQGAFYHHGPVGAISKINLKPYNLISDLILSRAHPSNFWEIVKGIGIRKSIQRYLDKKPHAYTCYYYYRKLTSNKGLHTKIYIDLALFPRCLP